MQIWLIDHLCLFCYIFSLWSVKRWALSQTVVFPSGFLGREVHNEWRQLPWIRTRLYSVQCVESLCSQYIIHLFSYPTEADVNNKTHDRQGKYPEWEISVFPAFFLCSLFSSQDIIGWRLKLNLWLLLKNLDHYACLAAIFELIAKVRICMWENVFPEPTERRLVTGGFEGQNGHCFNIFKALFIFYF